MLASSPVIIAIALVMIVTGVLMLAYVVRGLPRPTAPGLEQGDVVLVATKSKKKSKKAE